MNRVGLILLVGALAVTAATRFYDETSPLTETVLRPGVEYKYKYDSQVLTGIPNGGNQYSGLKLKCMVRVHMKTPSLVVMKLEEIKLCEVNTDLRTALPSEMISEEFCTPTTTEHTRVMTTELLKPISFKYESGLVSRLETDTSDPFWSVNIKRGILNLFQVSLTQEREVTDISPETFFETTSTDYTLRNVITKDRSVDKVFKVKEKDIVGDCETLYAVYEKDPTTTYCSECFTVTKVRDYKRCTNKVIYEQGLFAGHSSWLWLSHDDRKSLITPVTHVTYDLSGSRSSFLIRKAKLHSEYIFTPYSEEGGSMVTYVKLHLELIRTETPRVPITVGPSPVVHTHALLLHVPHALAKLGKTMFPTTTDETPSWYPESSKTPSWEREPSSWYPESPKTPSWERETPFRRSSYEKMTTSESSWEMPEFTDKTSKTTFGWPEEETEEEMWDESTFSKWESSYKKFDWTRDFTSMTPTSNLEKVRIMLKEITSTMTPYITEETPSKIMYLKRVLETCTADELWTIVNDMCSTVSYTTEPEFKTAKEIILDLLPVLPKPIVPHIIKSLVTKGVIFPKRGAYMISFYSLMAPAHPRIVKAMLSVCKDPVMLRTDEQLKRTCVLGLGTVTHKLFSMHIKTKVPKTMSFGIFDEVVRELTSLLTTSPSMETKVLALKAIGNTGLPEFLPTLHRIIREKTYTPLVRKMAVYALRRMTILSPSEVSKIVLPVFMDPRETPEMRIACFLMCIYTKPSTPTVMLMVHRLRTDPSVNLKSFVYSYLSSLSKTTLPTHRMVAKTAKLALLTMKPYDFGFSYSKGYHFDLETEKYNMGAMIESFLVHAPTSSLPKGFVTKIGAFLAHQPLYLVEMGTEVTGIDDVISSIYSRTRPMWSKLSSFDWSRFMTPEWYKEVYPEVTSWFSSTKWGMNEWRDWLKTFETTPMTGETKWGTVETTMRDILSKIKFEDRTFEMPELLTYFKILSNEMTYFNIDRSIISDIISSSEWMSTMMPTFTTGSTIPVNMMTTLPLIDNCFVIPTPIGMPLHLNFTALAVTKVTGVITPVSLPSLSDIWFSRSIPEIKVAVDVKPSFAIKTMCEMGVHLNVMKATTVVKGHVLGHVPIKSEVTLNWSEKKFKLNWEVPTETFTPLKVGMKVVTRIFRMPLRHYELITPSIVFDKEVVHPTVLKSIPITMSPLTTTFGTRVHMTTELYTRTSTWAPFYPLCGRFNVHFTCTPSEDRPKFAEFKMIFGSSYPTEYFTPRSTMGRTDASSMYDEWDVLSPIFPVRKDYTTSLRDEFETDITMVTPFTEITSPRSRHVTIIMRTIGGRRTSFGQSHITWIHSYDYLMHQFNWQCTCSTPFFDQFSSTPTKMVLDTVLNLKTIVRPVTTSDSLVAKMDWFYTDKSYKNSDFSMKVMTGRTGVNWESEYSPLSRYSWTSTVSGEKYEYYCTMKYSRLPTMFEDKLTHGLELVKVYFFPYLYVKKTGLTSEMNKVTAYIKFIPTHKKFTAIINTPTEMDMIVDVPTFNPMFMPETVSLTVPTPVLMSEGFMPSTVFTPEEFETTTSTTPRWSWFKSWTGMCSVTDSTVKTFDDVTYTMPEMPSTCETILARDCSSMGTWMVTMTPMTSSMTPMMTSMKMVRVMVPYYEFKVMPTSTYEPTTTVYVNGMRKMIMTGQPMMFPDTTMSPSGEMAHVISKEGDMIKIECVKTGMTIMTNGKYVTVQTTSMYRGRVCGMCGNFDGESMNEYEGPMKTIYERPEHFVVKYAIPSSECSVSDLVTKYNVPEYTFSGECVHEMRNVAKVTFLNGEKKICFTLKPEPVCGESCKRINPRPKYTNFHCLPASDVTTQTLLRESRVRVLSELAWKPVDLRDYIDTQDKCVSA